MIMDSLKTKTIVAILGIVLVGATWWRLDGMTSAPSFEKPNPHIHQWMSKQGAKVLFVESHELPMVDIQLLLPAGSSYDGDCPGIASFTASMLDEGTKTMDSDAIALAFESIGAEFGAGASADSVSIGLRTLRDKGYFTQAISLLHQVLTEPTFPEKSVERLRQNKLRSYDMATQQPSFVARKAYIKALYGDQPYAITRLFPRYVFLHSGRRGES